MRTISTPARSAAVHHGVTVSQDAASLAGPDDTIGGGFGPDSLVGGGLRDFIDGKDGNDTCKGMAGDDTLRGGEGSDQLSGGGGGDRLLGMDGEAQATRDTLLGGDGDDWLQGWVNDSINGGRGFDTFEINVGAGAFSADLSMVRTADVVVGGVSLRMVEAGVINLWDDAANIDAGSVQLTVFGGNGAETIHAHTASLVAYGSSRSDLLSGGSADDKLYDGDGFDTLHGGGGNDVLVLAMDQSGHDTAFGDDGDDRVVTVTNSSADTADGGAGYDTFEHTFDAYTAFHLNLSNLAAGMKIEGETVRNFEAAVLRLGNYNDSVVAGSATINVSGGSGADTLTGGAGADTLGGGLGDDVLSGGAGRDTLVLEQFGEGAKVDLRLTGPQDTGAGMDTITSFENVIGSTATDTIIGTDGANYLDGNGSAVLFGLGGNDTLISGGQVDSLTGGAGTDRFVISNGGGTHVTIVDLTAGETVDLRQVDADALTAANEAFHLVQWFDGGSAEAIIKFDSAKNQTVLTADRNADAQADFTLVISGGDFTHYDHLLL